MNSTPLERWLQRLDCIHPTEMELGLERVSAVAHALALLPLPQPVVTVAGTNGKGSTVAVLEALLQARGHATGTFTSPHLLRFNERIRVAGAEVADSEIVAAFEAIEAARDGVSLTYFEFATLAALLVFRERQPDVVILEVGLGGRLDSVNIVDPAVAVISSIDLDHQAWLGHTRGEIAVEKAGILRPGRPLVIADPHPPVELLDCASRVSAAPVLALGRDFTVTTAAGEWQAELWLGPGAFRSVPPQPLAGLLPANICAALQAALLLGESFSERELAQALVNAVSPGRREARRIGGRDYVLDVAHNPAAVKKLHEYISITHCKGKTIALFSAMADKDLLAMIQAARGAFGAWFLADQPGNARAAAASELATLLRREGQQAITVSKTIRHAFRRAQSILAEGDRLVVFGSFYTVADVLPLLDRDRRKSEAGLAT